ncbi:tetratricopeptide repeat protein [Prevotella dentasini]|uniref:tetratricopeptide repeat protein n=1 Tax=Prevotella dentasini TaxID=589537 RepID=UPI0004686E1D|nr:tetratricopeptide repeat protein [Prevotella dentasini]
MKQIFISLCVAIFLIGCQHNAVIDKHLLRIDSFYQEDFKDSANILLNKVDTTTLSPEDKRYFYLLKAMQDYSMENQKASFVHLNEAERHYKKTRNSLKLFKTYLCKVKLYSIKGEYVEAARYGKEAERIAEEKKDNELLAKAYSFMATLNGFSGNYNLALLYGKKTLETGRRMGNKRWIGFALDNIACTFQDMGETDSCQAYIARSMEYVRFMPKHEQPWLINNIGTYYTQKGDYKKAEAYFLQAIGQDPQPLFVGNLANIYQEQGRLSEAEKLWTRPWLPKILKQGCSAWKHTQNGCTRTAEQKMRSICKNTFLPSATASHTSNTRKPCRKCRKNTTKALPKPGFGTTSTSPFP